MEVKPATTYEQQIEKLRERGCYIRDERIAERILSQLNYYRFSAYFLPFRKEDETYREGTDFMTVYLIYEFDREMRLLLLGAGRNFHALALGIFSCAYIWAARV